MKPLSLDLSRNFTSMRASLPTPSFKTEHFILCTCLYCSDSEFAPLTGCA